MAQRRIFILHPSLVLPSTMFDHLEQSLLESVYPFQRRGGGILEELAKFTP